MALGPISPTSVPAPHTTPARDVGAAQRAFFQAALDGVQAAIEPPPAAPSPAQPEPKPEARNEASGGYRPGRLLDIKV
jgi:hypothetical protein